MNKIKLVKFKPYPEINPTGYAVGFNIIIEDNDVSHIDTFISFEESHGMIETDIVTLAINKLKTDIKDIEDRYTFTPLMGSIFEIPKD